MPKCRTASPPTASYHNLGAVLRSREQVPADHQRRRHLDHRRARGRTPTPRSSPTLTATTFVLQEGRRQGRARRAARTVMTMMILPSRSTLVGAARAGPESDARDQRREEREGGDRGGAEEERRSARSAARAGAGAGAAGRGAPAARRVAGRAAAAGRSAEAPATPTTRPAGAIRSSASRLAAATCRPPAARARRGCRDCS